MEQMSALGLSQALMLLSILLMAGAAFRENLAFAVIATGAALFSWLIFYHPFAVYAFSTVSLLVGICTCAVVMGNFHRTVQRGFAIAFIGCQVLTFLVS